MLKRFRFISIVIAAIAFCGVLFGAETNKPVTVRNLEILADALALKIGQGDYAYVVSQLQPVKEVQLQTTDGFSAYHVLVDYVAKRVPMSALEAWVKAEPESFFAYTIKGEKAIDLAWDARGSDWGYTVTDSGWDGFRRYLNVAKKSFENAYRIDPSDYVACCRMITVNRGLGDKDACRIWFERAIAIHPNYYCAYAEMATALYARWLGSDEEADAFIALIPREDRKLNKVAFDKIAKDHPGDMYRKNTAAGAEARMLVTEWAEAYPQSGLARRILSELSWWQGYREDALKWAKQAADLDPQFKNVNSCGHYHYEMGDYDTALAYARKAIEADPANFRGHRLMGSIHMDGFKDYPTAIRYFDAAVARGGDRFTYCYRANAYYETGDYEKAVSDYTKALEMNDEFADAYLGLGKSYYKLGLMTDADSAFKKAVGISSRMKSRVEAFKAAESQLNPM